MIKAEVHETRSVIKLTYSFNEQYNEGVKEVPNWAYVPRERGGPYWTVPLSLTAGRRLREQFGDHLIIGPRLKAWGRREARRERRLGSQSAADDAELVNIPADHYIARAIAGDALPELGAPARHPLNRKRDPRPYQRADIRAMVEANAINANGMGTGKTLEIIGAVLESATVGPKLIVAPVKSLEATWQTEIERFIGEKVYTAEDPKERSAEVAEGLERIAAGESPWIAVNPAMLRVKKFKPLPNNKKRKQREVARRDFKGNEYDWGNDIMRRLIEVDWAWAYIDEFHKYGLGNERSLLSLGMSLIEAEHKGAASGTPMGGKPIRLFPVFQWLNPAEFSSKWRWAEEWLQINDNGFGKTIGGFQSGREDEFSQSHAMYLIRRTKREALPGCPERVLTIVPCRMLPRQRVQYKRFERDAEIRIRGKRMGAQNILTEYVRLKQFANAVQEIVDGKPRPTPVSGKLDALEERLSDAGVLPPQVEPGARAIIAMQTVPMVEMIVEWLQAKGVHAVELTGRTKGTKAITDEFEEKRGDPMIIVMTIATGGVSLNLEAADSVHALDEEWNPDDMDQLFDRADRGGRTTPLAVYVYRTIDSIQEYIAEVAGEKAVTNRNVLDLRRQMLKRYARG